MSRKKKTLKQKRALDERRVQTAPPTQVAHPVYSISLTADKKAPNSSSSGRNLMFLSLPQTIHDLKKSLIVSAILIAINILIYLLLANNVVSLKMLGL